MKTESRPYWGHIAVAVSLALLATCPDAEAARLRGKVVKPPRNGPPPQTRTLTLPATYAAKAAAQSHASGGLAASKVVASSAPWTVVREPANQTPIFVEFNQPQAAAKRTAGIAPKAHVLQFITENAEMFRLRDPASELVHRATHEDRTERKHVQLEQRYLGVPVWGASIIGHWSAEQGLYAINGRYQPSPNYITEVEPSITRESAIDLALRDLKLHRSIESFSPRMQELLDYRGPKAELYLWSTRLEEPVRLTWVVEIRPNLPERWRYFVDALTGEILERYQASPSDGPAVGSGVGLHGNTVDLHTYEIGGQFYLLDGSREGFDTKTLNGALVTWDAQYTDAEKLESVTSTDNVFTDPVAVSAHDNTRRVYEYFLENHGRRGIFPDGRPTVSVIHVTKDGEPVDNAFWNGVLMIFGDGKDKFSPLAGALDVAAHEMTHGIISNTVGLEYKFQSGALNESFCDIFGAMVDDDDWLLGEDIVKNKADSPSGALRDLQNPHNGFRRQPAHMDEYQELDLAVDKGGVHINSGIHNRAAYLIAEAIGREKTARIYYHILDARYLSKLSKFIDCRLAAERAARELFGDGSTEVNAVLSAYEAVGIIPEQTPETPTPVAADLGPQWVAFVDAVDHSLWMAKPTSDALEGEEGWEYLFQLTTTQVLAQSASPITAPVNGDVLLFVDSDHNLRLIDADGYEEVVNDLGDWHSIALSPDGSRLVATTTHDEPIIWFEDLDQPDSGRWIELYQPTTQDSIYQDIARYADALRWDPSGTYIIYDVFNSLPGPAGETIDFWTVNALEPTSETIWPVLPAQPEGVHIAYPSWSSAVRTWPDGTIEACRLLYERVNEPNARTEIRVLDLCTGEEGVLYTVPEPIFTYPGFINGDREIVFQWDAIEDGLPTAHLFRQPLAEDGLSSQGEPLSFITYASLPHTMILASDDSFEGMGFTAVEDQAAAPQPTEFSLAQNYPNPFNAGTLISYSVPSASRVILDMFNIHGQRVATVDQGLQPAGTHTVSWTGLDAQGRPVASGIYFYRLRLPDKERGVERQTRKMLLLR